MRERMLEREDARERVREGVLKREDAEERGC